MTFVKWNSVQNCAPYHVLIEGPVAIFKPPNMAVTYLSRDKLLNRLLQTAGPISTYFSGPSDPQHVSD